MNFIKEKAKKNLKKVWFLPYSISPRFVGFLKKILPRKIIILLRGFVRSEGDQEGINEKTERLFELSNVFSGTNNVKNKTYRYALDGSNVNNKGALFGLVYYMELAQNVSEAKIPGAAIKRHSEFFSNPGTYTKNPLVNLKKYKSDKQLLLIVLPSYWRGGTEIATLDLVRGLVQENKYEIWVVATSTDFDEDIYINFINTGANIVYYPCERDDFPYQKAIIDLVDYINPSVYIIANSDNGYFVLPEIKKNNIKVIDVLHSEAPLGGSKEFENYIEKHIAVSKHIKDIFIKEYGPSKEIEVIYNSVNTELLKRKNIESLKRVIFLGRYSSEKLPVDFIKVAERVGKWNKDIIFEMYGEGPEKHTMEKYISDNKIKNIKVHGFAKDPYKVLEDFDALLLTSKTESFGLVIAEAMAVGLIVFSTDVGIASEIMKDGQNGFICKVGDIEGLSQKIIHASRLSSKELAKISDKASGLVFISGLTPDKMVQYYVDMLDKL